MFLVAALLFFFQTLVFVTFMRIASRRIYLASNIAYVVGTITINKLASLNEFVEVVPVFARGVVLVDEVRPLLCVFLLDSLDHSPDVVLLFIGAFAAIRFYRFGESLWNKKIRLGFIFFPR